MKITITIDQGADHAHGTPEAKANKAVMQRLAATQFPTGIMHGTGKDGEDRILTFSGNLNEFSEAMQIKQLFLNGKIDKKTRNEKFMPIYKKSEGKL